MAMKADPNHFKAIYNRAFSYDKIGKYEMSIADYTSAIQLDSKNANAYHNRGSTRDKVMKYFD